MHCSLTSLKTSELKILDYEDFKTSGINDTCKCCTMCVVCRMTGVGGRPEVVIEGSNCPDSGWREYEFYYKPGNTDRRPPIVGQYLVLAYSFH